MFLIPFIYTYKQAIENLENLLLKNESPGNFHTKNASEKDYQGF